MKHAGGTDRALRNPVLLRLRTDLNFWLRQCDGTPYYLVEDPLTGRYFRMGLQEWRLASALNGRQSLGAVLAQLRTQLGDACPTQDQAVTLCQWLVSSQLALAQGPNGLPVNWPAAQPPRPTGMDFLSNPLFIRVPLLNPDRFLAALLPWWQWMLSPVFFAAWLLLCLAGGYQVMTQWDRFTAATSAVIVPQNWLYLLLAWLGLKAVHETFHGLACKKYGGTVPARDWCSSCFRPSPLSTSPAAGVSAPNGSGSSRRGRGCTPSWRSPRWPPSSGARRKWARRIMSAIVSS